MEELIYDDREEEAGIKAYNFLSGRTKLGYQCKLSIERERVIVDYWKDGKNALSMVFPFITLKRGDLCWVKQGAFPIEIGVFTGRFLNDGRMVFSNDGGLEGKYYENCKKIGFNIFDGVAIRGK